MKKLFASIVIVLVAINSINAEDWSLYVWDYNGNAQVCDAALSTTADANVFSVSDVTIPYQAQFCVHNADWSVNYGWGSGAVDAVDVPVTLAASGATGWSSLPAGTYIVTFDASALTITFSTPSGETPQVWSLYVWDYNGGTGKDYGPFNATGTENVLVLPEVTMPDPAQYCVHNADWSIQYGWAKDAAATVSAMHEPAQLGITTSTSGWSSLPAFTYDVTFDVSALTISFAPHVGEGVKRVSILGDSYSTFYPGWLTPSSNLSYYSAEVGDYHAGQDMNSVKYTWWYKAIYDAPGYALERNNSYSGSTMVNTPLQDYDVATTFISRATNLGNPDIIFVCGGTNDNWNPALKQGEYQYSGWTEDDIKQFRPGTAYLMNLLQTTYPKAKIYFVLNDILDNVGNDILAICDHYSIPVISPASIDKVEYHPTIAGMATIAEAVKTTLNKDIATTVENASTSFQHTKKMLNGQVIIVRADGSQYDVLGREI